MHRCSTVPLASLLLLALAAATPAFAGQASPVPPPATAPAPAFAPASQLPVSAPALMPAEEQMISRSDLGLTPFYLPNGGAGLNLQGRFQEFATITVAPGGLKTFRCVDDADVLRRILFGPAEPAPVALEDR